MYYSCPVPRKTLFLGLPETRGENADTYVFAADSTSGSSGSGSSSSGSGSTSSGPLVSGRRLTSGGGAAAGSGSAANAGLVCVIYQVFVWVHFYCSACSIARTCCVYIAVPGCGDFVAFLVYYSRARRTGAACVASQRNICIL